MPKILISSLIVLNIIACDSKSLSDFEKSKMIYNSNKEEIISLGNAFFNQNTCVTISRFDSNGIDLPFGGAVLYNISSADDNYFSIILTGLSVDDEIKFWNTSFREIYDRNSNQSLFDIASKSKIDTILIRTSLQFLIKTKVRLINKAPDAKTVHFDFSDDNGIVYYPLLDYHSTYDEKGWKLDDHWYYFEHK
ncbi:MAG: hypothetical protein KDC73_10235 [Ignavibacteriae bacterium]|nr:hypothetical protein [Ignavibacteriota bacterium]MCB9242601.1 hypothetical protein [Ignavibacteriales bacterium]